MNRILIMAMTGLFSFGVVGCTVDADDDDDTKEIHVHERSEPARETVIVQPPAERQEPTIKNEVNVDR